jgi:putative transcriptional regulator
MVGRGSNSPRMETKMNRKKKSKKRNEFFDDIMAGMKEAVAIAEGRADPATYKLHVPEKLDVRAIREKQGLTQEEFALRYGFTVARLRDWEQNRYSPDGALRAYLLVIDRQPKAVEKALRVA